MWPIPHTMAKQLMAAAYKRILRLVMEDLVSEGITGIRVIVGDTSAEIRTAVGHASRWNCELSKPVEHRRKTAAATG
jgi:glucose-1-phosphate thymidylyltransferase